MSAGRTPMPDSRVSPRYAGLCTFGRYPRLADLDEAPDWILYGAPFDAGVTFRPGARFGPRAIREASQYLKPYHVTQKVDVPGVLLLADGGDAPVAPYSCEANARTIAEWATALPGGSETKLWAIGGDHSIALPNLRATHARQGAPEGGLALLHFDSHVDTLDEVWGERYGHASPFIRAIEEGLVDPARMLSIGVKGPLNTPDDLEFATERGVTLLTAEDARTGWGRERIEQFVRDLNGAPAYLSFDIDVVDPAFAPGTGTPSVGGFTSAETLAHLRSLSGANLVGGDLVEVLPERDPAGVTAFLAAHVIFEALAIDAAIRASG